MSLTFKLPSSLADLFIVTPDTCIDETLGLSHGGGAGKSEAGANNISAFLVLGAPSPIDGPLELSLSHHRCLSPTYRQFALQIWPSSYYSRTHQPYPTPIAGLPVIHTIVSFIHRIELKVLDYRGP